MSAYTFTDDMREISGFGGDYEACCRALVVAGLEWFDAHPNADPRFHGFKSIYGVVVEDNEDAKALSEVLVVAARPLGGLTGAMHQACIGHILAARRMGWEAYVAEARKPNDGDQDAGGAP